MPEQNGADRLAAHLEAALPTYLDELRQLCAIECPTEYKPGVDDAAAWVRRWTNRRRWTARTVADATAGDSVVVELAGGTPGGLRVLLAAHLDTVYPVGTAAERPVQQEGDRLLGPGTADNKSGLLSGLYAMAALEDLGLLGPLGAITLLCGGDEETDMRTSEALLKELAPGSDMVLVLEAGRENGDIVGARKGIGSWTLEVHGHAAHSGVEPHKGANAILALAQQVVALQLLNGLRPGASLNVGVISGGSRTNVVADYARAELEARVLRPEDMAPLGDAIALAGGTTYVAGTHSTLEGGWRYGPMARTSQIAGLASLAAACARELGFEVTDATTGGVSYANLVAALGVPVLDGLGPVGGLDHSPDEYILVSSIVPRTALLALLMLRQAQHRM
jgi:glutamate carboxypeptidase